MATLQEILGIGQSGLNASKSLMQLASFNVANASTPGYARQASRLSALQAMGLGVGVGDPQSVKSPFVAQSLVQTFGRQGFYDGQVSGLTLLEQATNDLDGIGLGVALTDFEGAIAKLAANPSGLVERQSLLDAARAVGIAFSATHAQFADASQATVSKAQGLAADASSLAEQVAALNGKIRAAAGGAETNALTDKRDQLVSELGSLVDLQVLPAGDGTVRLFTASGRPLVDGDFASQITVTGTSGPPEYAVQVQITKPDGQTLDALGPVGGQIGGLVAAQNEVIGAGLHQVDQMAYELVTQANNIHQAGYDKNGDPGLDLFEPILPYPGGDPALNTPGAAGMVKLSAASDGHPELIAAAQLDPATGTALTGDNSNALDLQALLAAQGVMQDGASLLGSWDSLVRGVASALGAAQIGSDIETSSAEQLAGLLASETGVSVDEEMIALSIANTAFSAAGRVIQEAQTMNDTLLGLIG